MILTKNYLEKLEKYQLGDLAEFIVSENFTHHGTEVSIEEYKRDIKSIYKEETKFFPYSKIFVARDYIGSLIGAIRVLKWNYTDLLPLTKIFGINPISKIDKYKTNDVFHIGRFAIKKDLRDIKLLKQLMMYAIAPVCQHEGNIAFAECDRKLLRTLTLMGIKVTVLGESINYLGSETIPMSMDYDGLIDFYNKNIGLISEDELVQSTVSNVHKNIVYDYNQHYYSVA